MPGGDRTGPSGQGPMTGRAAGFCTGNQVPGYANPGGGRGFGMGQGQGGFGRGQGGRGRGGFGRRNQFNATGLTGWQRAAQAQQAAGDVGPMPQPTQPVQQSSEVAALMAQAETMVAALSDIQARLNQLETRAVEKNAEAQGE